MKRFLSIILIIIGAFLIFGSIIEHSVENTITGHDNVGALWTVGIIGVIAIISGLFLRRK